MNDSGPDLGSPPSDRRGEPSLLVRRRPGSDRGAAALAIRRADAEALIAGAAKLEATGRVGRGKSGVAARRALRHRLRLRVRRLRQVSNSTVAMLARGAASVSVS